MKITDIQLGMLRVPLKTPFKTALHVAIAKVDLDGPSLCQFNPVDGGVIFNESEISVTDAPGLGVREICGLESL
jgi:hypothetical protein